MPALRDCFGWLDLRHTFASQIVMDGIDLAGIKELLGHRSLAMTMRYEHLTPGRKRKTINVLDQSMQNSVDKVFENANGTKTAHFEKNEKACLS